MNARDAQEMQLQNKKRALPLALHNEAMASSLGVADDKDMGVQGNVDCALAAFVAKHKLDLSIFHSSEWEDVLEAVNQGPLPPLNEYYNGSVPAVLLARTRIHRLLNARAAAREAH